MSRIRRIAPGLGRGGLIGNTEGPESYLRELDTLPSQFCRATGGTETVISQGGKFYRVHTFTDTDPTSLLLNFDGANGSTTFTDDSGWGHAVTANGDAQISTTQSKFGGSSAYFDGNGDYLTVLDSPQFEFGSGDFTIEGWFYIAGNSSQNNNGERAAAIAYKWPTSGTPSGFAIYITGDATTTGTGIAATAYNAGSALFTTSYSGTITQNTWHNFAFCRNGSTTYLFLNGSEVASTTGVSGSIPDTAHSLRIAASPSTGFLNQLNGYIDSLRITKGQALYTSAFTPSTTALTRVGSGSLTFTRGGAVEYLVVGGGGGGSFGASGGGGGAGGYSVGSRAVIAGEHSVEVGSGGAGGASLGAPDGANGASSTAFSLIPDGGGGGAKPGKDGGSGGGGSLRNQAGGTATGAGLGSDGGAAVSGGSTVGGGGGGGGGASENGTDGTTSLGGDGGDGLASSISGSSVTYAGGGGGGGRTDGTAPPAGSGGAGGGGDGSQTSTAAESGTANTGGGGGGGGFDGTGGAGGSGGSGIVIARYRITQAEYEAEAA